MALEEYSKKRHFDRTPEPAAKLAGSSRHRFVVQKHRASHLHYDFRLEMEGVLKSWAVPKGPSLDPADKRLAMQVEDHPVSYFDFEGVIPPGNYGAGTVMVWDMGSWEPTIPEAGKKAAGAAALDGYAADMLRKGDFKFRLNGKKLKGEFVLVKLRSRRAGSKGTEWLLIKHRDQAAQPGYDIEKLDYSVLTGRSLDEIAADEGSAEWQSSRPAAKRAKEDWLAGSIAKHDRLQAATAKRASGVASKPAATRKPAAERAGRGASAVAARKQHSPSRSASREIKAAAKPRSSKTAGSHSSESDAKAPRAAPTGAPTGRPPLDLGSVNLGSIEGAEREAMPEYIRPMLATLVDRPFDSRDWLYEVKWDGYRALAFVKDDKVRLLSRNQNELTSAYPELSVIPDCLRGRNPQAKASTAILDGEIVALDEQGRSSFSLMQQRTGIGEGGRRVGVSRTDVPIRYYVFDLLYLDGYNLMRVELETRKRLLREILIESDLVRYSEHFDHGTELYRAAAERELEGIIAKRRASCYLAKRSREWLKIKLSQQQECVIGGYTDPRGSREHFGSLVLGLYDHGRLLHVGQAGTGFNSRSQQQIWKLLQARETAANPFANKVEATRRVHFVRPELVAQVKFAQWTHEGQSGAIKMRAPVFLGLRQDKRPEECIFERPRSAKAEAALAETGEAA